MGGPPAPDTTAPYLADLVTSLWAISTLGVVSRFALRARGYAGRLGLDDAVMALGWVLWTALWILTIIRFDTWGLGRPSDERWSDDLVVRLGKTTLVALELFTLSACAVRVSVLLFHRRLTADVTRYHRPIVAGIAFIIAWSLAVSIAFIFQCDPVEGFWMRLVSSWVEAHPNFQCYPEFPVSIVSAICALLSDLFAVIFPCWIVHKLANLSPRERIGLVLLFASGMLVSVARVFQVYYVTRESPPLPSRFPSLSSLSHLTLLVPVFYLPQMRRTRSFEIFYGLVSGLSYPGRSALTDGLRQSAHPSSSPWACSSHASPPCTACGASSSAHTSAASSRALAATPTATPPPPPIMHCQTTWPRKTRLCAGGLPPPIPPTLSRKMIRMRWCTTFATPRRRLRRPPVQRHGLHTAPTSRATTSKTPGRPPFSRTPPRRHDNTPRKMHAWYLMNLTCCHSLRKTSDCRAGVPVARHRSCALPPLPPCPS